MERLKTDPTLRRLCGWETAGRAPSEATFSRAFGEFAASDLPGRLHEALLDRTLEGLWRATCRGTRRRLGARTAGGEARNGSEAEATAGPAAEGGVSAEAAAPGGSSRTAILRALIAAERMPFRAFHHGLTEQLPNSYVRQ